MPTEFTVTGNDGANYAVTGKRLNQLTQIWEETPKFVYRRELYNALKSLKSGKKAGVMLRYVQGGERAYEVGVTVNESALSIGCKAFRGLQRDALVKWASNYGRVKALARMKRERKISRPTKRAKR